MKTPAREPRQEGGRIDVHLPYVPHRGSPLTARWDALRAWIRTLPARLGPARPDDEPSWTLPARPSAVASARRLTEARLAAWGLREQAPAAADLVAELVGDALGRGATTVRLALLLEDGLLRCEVEAGGTPPLPPACPAPPYLPVCCWGVSEQIAWFELVTAGYDAHHPAHDHDHEHDDATEVRRPPRP